MSRRDARSAGTATPRLRSFALVAFVGLAGCETQVTPVHPPTTPTTPTTPVAPKPTVTPIDSSDPIGGKPTLTSPKAFTPPAPEVFNTPNGITVWLLERHALPMVSISVAIPRGSAQDPADLPGLAHITANMLDEGAGSRNAVELSSAVNDLGATLSTGNTADGSFASLTVLKKNYEPAFAILADVVARPRFDPKEWKRVSELWQNDLKKRPDDASAVSRVVTGAVLYGPGTPYGHPSDGLLRGAQKIGLGAAKEFYRTHWRPEHAVLVVAGDVTKAEITASVTSALGAWKSAEAGPKSPAASPASTPAAPLPASRQQRLVLVDRPGAPQSVIAVARDGVSANDPKLARLELINTALGGSFTSRLNQNLREEKAWSYGARSAFTEVRGQGAFLARASVLTDKTGPALREVINELRDMAESGLKPDELLKVRAQDRADLVQTYEAVNSITGRLATLAALGLPPGFDATSSRVRQAATLQELAALARAHVDPTGAILVVVGPRSEVASQLGALGLNPEPWDAEGNPLAAQPPAKKAATQPTPAKQPAPAKKPPAPAGKKK